MTWLNSDCIRIKREWCVCKQLERLRSGLAANRGTVWADKEVKALIAIWGKGAVRNKVVYENILKKMKEQGYNRDW